MVQLQDRTHRLTRTHWPPTMESAKRHEHPQQMAFSPARRLRQAAEFRHVFAKPIKSGDALFGVVARRRVPESNTAKTHNHQPRLGLAISRKCATRAVDRNRIKRVVREIFRQSQALSNDKARDLDFVVMCRPAAKDADNASLGRSLERHFLRIRDR